MKIKLQNIGIIEEADINIEGITLIAGQNDSGKSTVGKVLYSIIKGFNQNINLFLDEKNNRIIYRYQDILKELKKNVSIDITEFQTKEISLEWFEKIEKTIKLESTAEDSKKALSDSLRMLKLYFNVEYNTIEQKKDEITNWLRSEIATLHNIFNTDAYSIIEIEDLEGNAKIKQWFKEINFYILELDNNLETYFKEAYFIESPAIIDDSLQRFVGKDSLQLHSRNRQEELAKSLSNPLSTNISDYSTIYREISEIINGEITIDLLQGVKYKKNEQEINIKNTAVGIKSFGLIQLLLKNNRLNNRTLLIIDEPEVHLHPTWQVKYAEILVKLSKDFDIPMVLTSHSPYFIEAIEAYSKKNSYENSTNFYFAKKNEDGLSSKIIDVTKDITPILSSISDAFYKIQDINNED
ncbi:AAA family ATPase [Flavobacterium pectinovorum]|uniref:AAA family ATPase n=1 Tax=Flavobacterium pectinovorum TaxID=29533 RepID=UPI001FAE368D|nr:AAA family ATPase [Flavobacterium pectinovorum]MCI9843260.1 AAA family ATPase [Flavobacterium pectinovorum]